MTLEHRPRALAADHLAVTCGVIRRLRQDRAMALVVDDGANALICAVDRTAAGGLYGRGAFVSRPLAGSVSRSRRIQDTGRQGERENREGFHDRIPPARDCNASQGR